jgi:predicted dehydrogenase
LVSAFGSRWPRADAPDADVADVSAALVQFGDIPATFTASCVLGLRHAIELQLICAGRVVTITEQQVTVGTDQFATTVDPFLAEDAAFLDAIRTHDPNRVLSSYADALQTHRLCCAIRDAMATTPSSRHPPAA